MTSTHTIILYPDNQPFCSLLQYNVQSITQNVQHILIKQALFCPTIGSLKYSIKKIKVRGHFPGGPVVKSP